MKLTRTDIDRANGVVRCEVTYKVQDNVITIPFRVTEAELINSAKSDGRYTWDDIDIKQAGDLLLESNIEI